MYPEKVAEVLRELDLLKERKTPSSLVAEIRAT
jgi:hypothetical protein